MWANSDWLVLVNACGGGSYNGCKYCEHQAWSLWRWRTSIYFYLQIFHVWAVLYTCIHQGHDAASSAAIQMCTCCWNHLLQNETQSSEFSSDVDVVAEKSILKPFSFLERFTNTFVVSAKWPGFKLYCSILLEEGLIEHAGFIPIHITWIFTVEIRVLEMNLCQRPFQRPVNWKKAIRRLKTFLVIWNGLNSLFHAGLERSADATISYAHGLSCMHRSFSPL